MDRDAHVRSARRRQVEDALAFERERERMLVEELEDVLAEAAGEEVDSAVFAEMDADDAGLVRVALGQAATGAQEWEGDEVEDDLLDDDGLSSDEDDDDDPDEFAEAAREVEIARLQAEIESSRGSQAALGRYLELLERRNLGGEDRASGFRR